MKPLVAAICIALSLAGCSSIQQVLPGKDPNPPKPLKEFSPTANVKTLWQVNTGSSTGKDYVRIHPYANESAVFAAGGRFASAWSKTNGGRIWQTPIDGEVTGGVNGGEGSVFLGTSNGSAIALDAQTGKVRWSTRLSSEVLAVSSAQNGIVAFRTSDGALHGVAVQTGEILWQQLRQSPVLSLRGAGVPVLAGGMVIAGFDNGVVTAFDMRNGNAIWEAVLSVPREGSDIDKITDVDGKLKTLGDALFAASYNGQIAGINMRSGSAAWAAPYSSYTGVDADPNGLYSTNSHGDLWKLAPLSGQPVWKMDDLASRQPTAPSLMGNYVMVGDKEGFIHWINAETGKFAARTRGDNAGYTVSPLVDGNIAYTLGRGGLLSAFAIQ